MATTHQQYHSSRHSRNMKLLLLFLLISYLHLCKGDEMETNRMLGIDTSHNMRIDKDTIITRNLNLDIRKKGKIDEAEAEPDWSYNAIPSDVAPHAQEFKQNMSECLKEVQANDKRRVRRLSPKTESPVNGECLIACVLRRAQVIDNGKIIKANLISLVSKFYAKDTKMIKKLDKNLDRCIEMSAHIREECHLAAQLNSCTNDLMASNKHKISINYK